MPVNEEKKCDRREYLSKPSPKNEFFCGTCQAVMKDFRIYFLHIRRHDAIINEGSSHIIIRRKGEPAYPLAVVPEEETDQNTKYECACDKTKVYTRSEFIQHVLKWHKGVTPKI